MNRPIHIQHVVLSLRPGGLENGVVNVVNGLDPNRFQSSICCLKQAGEFASRVQQTQVSIHEMGLQSGNDYTLPFRLARLFRKTRTDIVHTRNPEAFFYGFLGAKLGGVRRIIHSEHGRRFPDKLHRMFLQRLFSRFTDNVFAVSEQLKRDLVAHVGLTASRIEVLYNGVDPNRFVDADRAAIRDKLGVHGDEIVIGSVGRLAPVKNYNLLLEALPGLRARHNATLMFVGDGPEHSALKAAAERLQIGKHVRFLGHRDDVRDLLAAMDIFVLPSHSEGMSNTLLEAMAAGVPVVASDVGGNAEIVRNSQDGLIFPAGDIGRLHDCLTILCGDAARRQQLGQAGRTRVMQEFSIQKMIACYEELYSHVFCGARTRQR